jgi:hypothetical protein
MLVNTYTSTVDGPSKLFFSISSVEANEGLLLVELSFFFFCCAMNLSDDARSPC